MLFGIQPEHEHIFAHAYLGVANESVIQNHCINTIMADLICLLFVARLKRQSTNRHPFLGNANLQDQAR
jgi:hypothetical protein